MNPRRGMAQAPLFLALLAAPWAGSSHASPWYHVARGFLLLALFLWGGGCWRERRWPRVPVVLLVAVAALFLEGAWMTLNGAATSNGVPGLVAALPGSVHRADSLRQLPDLLMLMGALLLVVDESRHYEGRRFYWHAGIWSALPWVMWGLAEKMRQGVFVPNGSGRVPFGTFEYHANAGAYMNLVWPVAVGLFLSLLASRRPVSAGARGGAVLAAAVPLAATFVNVSRACTFIALVLAAGCAAWVVRQAWRGGFPLIDRRQWLVFGGLMGVLVGGMIFAGGADRMIYRWHLFRGELVPDHHRLLATRAWLGAVPEAGLLGFGPGTFTNVAPRFAGDLGNGWIAAWPYAHVDPLQFVMEWGWVGGTLWAAVFAGAFVHAWRADRGAGERLRGAEGWMRFGLFLSLGGLFLHGLVDYPFQVFPIQLVAVCQLGVLWGLRPVEARAEEGAGREM